MSKISSYPNGSISNSVKLIGTAPNSDNETFNFTIADLVNFINSQGGYYGSFYDITDQNADSINTAKALTYGNTDLQNGVRIYNNSRILIDNAGKYNIQFSAQLHDTSGGSSTIDIWLSKNGTAVPNSNTTIVMAANTYHVAAWNFFVSANANDYFEIMWATTDLDLKIEYEPSSSVHPATPSVILTVNQIG